MKKISKNLLLSSILIISSNLAFAQPKNVVLPKIFTSEKVMMKDRICGELLVAFSIVGAKNNNKEKQKFAEELATDAVILLELSSGLTKNEKLQAKKISRQIENLSESEHIGVTNMCAERVNYLYSSNVISDVKYEEAENMAKMMLKKVLKK